MSRGENAVAHFIDRHVREGRGPKVAFIDDSGGCTYAELFDRVNRSAGALRNLDARPGDRVMLCLLDGVDFVAAFWGAIRIGAVPVPVSTLLTPPDYHYMLAHSEARVLIVSAPLLDQFEPALRGTKDPPHVITSGGTSGASGELEFSNLCAKALEQVEPIMPSGDRIAFWLYSSGSTGRPKAVPHRHDDLRETAALYGERVLGIRGDDLVYSAARLFFAYGLGNSMTFPLHAGASAALVEERPTPALVAATIRKFRPTIFFAVPTLYASILSDRSLDANFRMDSLRMCVSAGEALPESIAQRWRDRFGLEIIDGLGTTESGHIFISNRPGDVRHGTAGKPVPGYDVRILLEDGTPAPAGQVGDLWCKGPSFCTLYWNDAEASARAFANGWMRTGDKFVRDEDGYFRYAGRADDMLKVGGIWVSPFEVESALLAHPDVAEAAVIGAADADGLIKPKAFVVLQPGVAPSEAVAIALKAFVKGRLAPYKYPRWIEFCTELPKTATGKIQRYKLRER